MTILRLEVSNPDYSRENTQTLTVYSSHLKRRADVTIYNAQSTGKNVPVVILLHGVYGNNWVWMDLGGVHKVYEQLKQEGLSEFVLVMPSDGGLWDGSAYLPLKEHGNYEQWIVDDVITAVKQTVNAVSESSNVYITGLSMGGYGALRLGAKYPELFSGISAHSAITKLDDLKHFTETPLNQYQCDNSNESDIIYWLNNNKNNFPPLRLDCGAEDTLYESNLNFVEQLKSNNIEHHFESLSGCHEWPYWHKNVAKTFHFFDSLENKK